MPSVFYLQHELLPYCAPCYVSLYGPEGYRQGFSPIRLKNSLSPGHSFDVETTIDALDVSQLSQRLSNPEEIHTADPFSPVETDRRIYHTYPGVNGTDSLHHSLHGPMGIVHSLRTADEYLIPESTDAGIEPELPVDDLQTQAAAACNLEPVRKETQMDDHLLWYEL